MKHIMLLMSGIIIVGLYAFVPHGGDHETLELGAKAPLTDNKMKDISGVDMSLKNKMGKNGLLVIFSCNTCPFVIGRKDSEGWEGRYNDIGNVAGEAGIGAMMINSNEAKRDEGDSFTDMVARSKEKKFNMAYVLDRKHVMADAFGARTTPHVFLFDNQYKLVYKGAIDDNNDSSTAVNSPWLKNALQNLAAGKPIDPATTRAIGCSIKRVNAKAK